MDFPKLPPQFDRRVKILPSDYDKVKVAYKNLGSFRAVARLLNVDKGTIKAIIDPIWYDHKQKKRYLKKPWLENNVKGEERNLLMRNYRAYKVEIQPKEYLEYCRSRKRKKYKIITCPTCGIEFMPSQKNLKYCNKKCRLIRNNMVRKLST